MSGADPKVKAAYLKFMIEIASLLNNNKTQATHDMTEVFNLETLLAKVSWRPFTTDLYLKQ